jgi:hypothetical protein
MAEEHIQLINENKHPNGDTQKPDDTLPVAPVNVGKVDSKENIHTSETDKKKRKCKPLSCIEIWTIVLGFTGIFVAAGTGAAIYWQARIGAHTLTEIKKGSTDTHDLAVAAQKQADAAKVQSDNTAILAQAATNQASAAADQVRKLQAGVIETAKLATAAINANTIANRSLEAQTRPWIGIDGVPEVIETRVSNSPPGKSVIFNLKLRNYGSSPALTARPAFAVIEDAGTARITLFDQYEMCPRADEDLTENNPRRVITSVFPGIDASITQEVVAASKPSEYQPATPPESTRFSLLIGCIAYKGPAGGPYHMKVLYSIEYSRDLKTSRDGIKYPPVTGFHLRRVDPR